MKKLFIVLAVASLGFVACNNEAEVKDVNADSIAAAATADSLAAAAKTAADSLAALAPKVDSLGAAVVDTTKH